MLNRIVKRITGKDIVLYYKNYRTQPLASNVYNRKRFWFINVTPIWRYIPFRISHIDKRKQKVMYFILKCIHPKYILDINWISKYQSLYRLWTLQNPDSEFIVLQHGSYSGGIIVTDKLHKYTHCDIFLSWGPYFVDNFKVYNSGKNVRIINFGNSIFNSFDRKLLNYKEYNSNKILILPTALNQEDISHFNKLINKLKHLGFQVVLKEHHKQGKEKCISGNLKYPILDNTGIKIIRGSVGSIYQILEKNEYDFIISDQSSSLLDAIFFKNKVIYFDPNNISKGYITHYSKFLCNLYLEDYNKMNRNDFYEFLNIQNQEAMFANMVCLGDNRIDSLESDHS